MVLLSNTGLIVCKMAVYIIKIRNCQIEFKKKAQNCITANSIFFKKKSDNCHNFYFFF